MAEGSKNPASGAPEAGASPAAAPQNGQQTPAAPDNSSQAVMENFEKEKEKMVEQVDDIFSRRISAGSQRLDSRALQTIRSINESQKKAVAGLFDAKRQEYEKRAAASAGLRTQLAEQLLKDANEEAKHLVAGLEAILKKYTKDVNITTEEVYEVYKAVIGYEQLSKQHPELQAMVEKMGNSQELTDDDFRNVVKLLNPANIKVDRDSASKSFEASSAGAVINMMRPDQRYRLIQFYMESEQKDSTQRLLEGFLSTGVINRYQVEQAMKLPQAAGISFSQDFKDKLARGYFEEQAQQVQAKMQEEVAKDFSGSDARNVLDKFVGDGIIDSPLVYVAMMAWGAITSGMNLIASLRVNWDDIPGTLKDFADRAASNPYVFIGAAAMGVGYQGFTGNMDSRGFMGGNIVGWLESMSQGDQDEAIRKNARKISGEIYLNSPRDFAAYIDGGGFQTMLDLKAAKVAENKPPLIKIDDLINQEKDPGRKAILTSSLKSMKDIDKKLNYFAEAAVAMDINSTQGMEAELSKIRSEQTSAAAASTAPAAAPANSPLPSPPKPN